MMGKQQLYKRSVERRRNDRDGDAKGEIGILQEKVINKVEK